MTIAENSHDRTRDLLCKSIHNHFLKGTGSNHTDIGQKDAQLCSLFQLHGEQSCSKNTAMENGDKYGERKPLLLSALLPKSSKNSQASQMAIRIALWHVNFCSDLPAMKQFYLTTELFDSSCSAGRGSWGFVEVYGKQNTLGVIGPKCSAVAIPTARYASFLRLPIVSHGAEASQLSNRDHFKTFFRLPLSRRMYQPILLMFVARFSRKEVAVIYDIDRYSLSGEDIRVFLEELRKTKVKIALSIGFSPAKDDPIVACDKIRQSKASAVLAMVDMNCARQLLCASQYAVSGLDCFDFCSL